MEEEEVHVNDKKHKKDKDNKEKPKFVVRTLADLQRLKLEKLMKNPDKPVIIPESAGEKDFKDAIPSFVRNVMGSSAGAGSGEFHVYRHLRQKLDQEYRDRLETNQKFADEKTAKKRAKRLKKKQNHRQKKPKLSTTDNCSDSENNEDNETLDEEDQQSKSEEEKESDETVKDCPDGDKSKTPEKQTQEDGNDADQESSENNLAPLEEHNPKEDEVNRPVDVCKPKSQDEIEGNPGDAPIVTAE